MPNPNEKTIQYHGEPAPRGVISNTVVLAEVNGYNTPFYVRGVYTSKYRARRAALFFYRYLPEYDENAWEELGTRWWVNKSLPYCELHMVKCELDSTYTKQLNTVKEALKNAKQSTVVHEGSESTPASNSERASDIIEESS